ncbi:hypothetical protein [Clostridium estertheticum]|nr:hypothetical protein [Clostridium estertheticum]
MKSMVVTILSLLTGATGDSIKNASTETEALTIATEIFGVRGG